jgi:2,3-bisphosphoglycerate-independent phosphoglycerate mutase
MRGISEEFLAPIVIGEAAVVREGDTLVFFNHRADGMRQLARSITGTGKTVHAICMTEYDKGLDLPVVFSPDGGENSLSDILALANLSQIQILQAESSHNGEETTSFVPAGENIVFRNRTGISASDEPEMSSFKIANELIERLDEKKGDFFVVNLPAADITASEGDAQGVIEAIQYIDTCLGGMVDKILEADGTAIITSPGSNFDFAERRTELENSGPLEREVPFHLIEKAGTSELKDGGTLSDIAPTILAIFGLAKPPEMSGNDLRSSS